MNTRSLSLLQSICLPRLLTSRPFRVTGPFTLSLTHTHTPRPFSLTRAVNLSLTQTLLNMQEAPPPHTTSQPKGLLKETGIRNYNTQYVILSCYFGKLTSLNHWVAHQYAAVVSITADYLVNCILGYIRYSSKCKPSRNYSLWLKTTFITLLHNLWRFF